MLNYKKIKIRIVLHDKKRIMVSGEMLKDASPTFDRNNSPSVSFQLSPLGGKKFGRVTGKHW